jgi:hypothetical protein
VTHRPDGLPHDNTEQVNQGFNTQFNDSTDSLQSRIIAGIPTDTRRPGEPLRIAQAEVKDARDDNYTFGDLAKASFETENSIGSWLASNDHNKGFSTVPQAGYDFVDDKDFEGYEVWIDEAIDIDIQSPMELQMFKADIDRQLENRKIIESAGALGFAAEMAAGITDPINIALMLLPGGAAITASKTALGAGARLATVNVASEIPIEAIKQSTQSVRTAQEGLAIIGGTAILSGVLGAGLKGLSNRQIKKLADSIDQTFKDVDDIPTLTRLADEQEIPTLTRTADGEDIADIPTLNDVVGNSSLPRNVQKEVFEAGTVSGRLKSMGAAQATIFVNSPKDLAIKGSRIINAKALDTTAVSPQMRLATSPSPEAQQTLYALDEVALYSEGNLQGVSMSEGGAAATQIKNAMGSLAIAVRSVDDLYTQYRGNKGITRLAEDIQNKFVKGGVGKLSKTEFREAVGKAMRRGDEDINGIPEVTAAAKETRKYFDEWKDKAIEAELLPEGVTTTTAKSYLQRVYNKKKILGNLNEANDTANSWRGTIRNWLVSDMESQIARSAQSMKVIQELSEPVKVSTEKLGRLDKSLGEFRKELAEERATIKRLDDGELKTKTDKRIKGLQKNIKELVEERNALHAETKDPMAALKKAQRNLKKVEEDFPGMMRSAEVAVLKRGIDDVDVNVLSKQMKAILKKDLDNQMGNTSKNLELVIDELTEKIIGSPSGRIPYDAVPSVRGPLKERVLNIPDKLIEDFLDNDIGSVIRQHHQSVVPDVIFKNKFGSTDLRDQIAAVKDSYAAKMRNLSGNEAQAMQRRLESDVMDIEGVRDLLRGTYKVTDDPDSFIYRLGRGIRDVNFLRMLGGMTLSAIPDIAAVISRQGMRQFVPALKLAAKGILTDFRDMRLEEIMRMGIGTDMITNSRAISMGAMDDVYARNTKLERGLASASDTFSKMTLMSQWNTMWKQATGLMSVDKHLRLATQVSDAADKLKKLGLERTAENIVKHSKVKKGDILRMANNGIGIDDAAGIAREWRKANPGDEGSQMWIANGSTWDQEVYNNFKAATLKDVDRTIITPTASEMPLVAQGAMGKMVVQFKSFIFSAHHKLLLSDMQAADSAAMFNVLSLTALGYVSFMAKEVVRDASRAVGDGKDPATAVGLAVDALSKRISDNPLDAIIESMDRSGQQGLFWEAHNMIEKASRGSISVKRAIGGAPMSRYQSRNILGALLGPTAGTVEDSARVFGAVAQQASGFGDGMNAGDVKAIRRMMPYQNLFWLRSAFDAMENSAGQALGVEQ